MNINQRQFEQLTEMGISLWKSRLPIDSNGSVKDQKSDFLTVDLNDIGQKQLFKDIIQCLNISIGEISYQKDHLDLGLFNWYFTSNTEDETIAVRYLNNNLTTPNITTISHSTELKKQLWHIIKNDLL